MAKLSVNLIVKKEAEATILRRLKIILPVVSIVSLVLFVIAFFISTAYINQNSIQFEFLKKQVEMLETKVTAQKTVEGVYSLTASRLGVLDEIVGKSKKFFPTIFEVSSLQMEGINIISASTDAGGNISFSLVASSSATLDEFITLLITKEEKKLFSQMLASGIVREKKGNYHLTISLKGNPSLFQ